MENEFSVFFSLPALEELSPLPEPLKTEVWQESRRLAELALATPISTPSHGDAPYLFRLEVRGIPFLFEVRRLARLLMVTHLGFDPAQVGLAARPTG